MRFFIFTHHMKMPPIAKHSTEHLTPYIAATVELLIHSCELLRDTALVWVLNNPKVTANFCRHSMSPVTSHDYCTK